MTQTSLSQETRALSTLSRVDYSDAFLLDAGVELSPRQWARTMIEDAPRATRVRLVSGWMSLGLRLRPRWISDRVLGWKVQENKPSFLLLKANSWLGLKAELHFHAAPGGVLFATLVQQDNALTRRLWKAITPTHQVVVRSLLLNAARRSRATRGSHVATRL